MPELKEDNPERPVVEVVVRSQLYRFARIGERRFRVVFRQVPQHREASAQSVRGRELRVALEKLVIDLPGESQRRGPILYPALERLGEITVGQHV